MWCEQCAHLVDASLIGAVAMTNQEGLCVEPNFVSAISKRGIGELPQDGYAKPFEILAKLGWLW
jgi:hypothetical protein